VGAGDGDLLAEHEERHPADAGHGGGGRLLLDQFRVAFAFEIAPNRGFDEAASAGRARAAARRRSGPNVLAESHRRSQAAFCPVQ
jgi:hypothetical protein